MLAIKTLQDVVDWGMCVGCGACAYACTEGGVSLVNIEPVGIRPKIDAARCGSCSKCLSICPGYAVDATLECAPSTSEADHEFGATLEIWEGYASDAEIRHSASSGGLLSALTLYCLERENMEFALHIGMDEAQPWVNKTVQSRNRSEILQRTGSRYAPASPCDGLAAIEQSERPCVFIGKPCDTAAVAKLRRERPKLDSKLGLVLTFFCAGTPSSQGTLDLVDSLDIQRSEVTQIRYRGEGWPGRFKATAASSGKSGFYSYEQSWGKLTGYRPMRCNLCPDGLGRVADISCGDAWHQYGGADNPGRSLVIVRTRRGQQVLRRAMAANYVTLKPANANAVLAAQQNLLQRRRELFGRLLAMKILGVPIPQFTGFSLWHSWQPLSLGRKVRSILGTMRRVIKRRLWRRHPLFTQVSSSSACRHDSAGSSAAIGMTINADQH